MRADVCACAEMANQERSKRAAGTGRDGGVVTREGAAKDRHRARVVHRELSAYGRSAMCCPSEPSRASGHTLSCSDGDVYTSYRRPKAGAEGGAVPCSGSSLPAAELSMCDEICVKHAKRRARVEGEHNIPFLCVCCASHTAINKDTVDMPRRH